MNHTVEYPGSWPVFLNAPGMNVVNLFSGNHSQGFQGVGSLAAGEAAAAQSRADSACSVPAHISSQVGTNVRDLLSTSISSRVSIGSKSTVDSVYS